MVRPLDSDRVRELSLIREGGTGTDHSETPLALLLLWSAHRFEEFAAEAEAEVAAAEAAKAAEKAAETA